MDTPPRGTPPTAAPRPSSLRGALNRHPMITGVIAVLVILGTGALIYWESRPEEVGPPPDSLRDRGREVRSAPATQPDTAAATEPATAPASDQR